MNDGYVTVNVTKANAYNPTLEHAGVLRMLNEYALEDLRRETEAAIKFWTHPALDPMEPWRIELREYVNDIRKEREHGNR